MRPIMLSAVFLIAAVLTGCVMPPRQPIVATSAPVNFDSRQYSRIVVIPKVQGMGGDLYQHRGHGVEANIVESAVVADLLNKGFTVVERSDLDRVLKEIGLQSGSGLTDTSSAIKVGKMLNADGLLIVDLNQLNESVSRVPVGSGSYIETRVTAVAMSAKFVSIQQGTQVWVGSYTGRRPDETADAVLPAVVQAIMEKFPSKMPVAAPAPAPAPAAGAMPPAPVGASVPTATPAPAPASSAPSGLTPVAK